MKKASLFSLGASMLLCSCSYISHTVSGDYHYQDAENYQPLEGKVSLSEINKIDIGWLSGRIILQSEGDTLSFYEEEVKMKKYLPLYYRVKDHTLSIHYVKSLTTNQELQNVDKVFYLNIPKGDAELSIDSVSGSIEAKDLQISSLSLDTVSATFHATSLDCVTTKINTVSGNVKIDSLSSSAVSIDFDSVSANLTVGTEDGYHVSFDTVSGIFRSYQSNEKKYGSEKLHITADTVSGSVSIVKPA